MFKKCFKKGTERVRKKHLLLQLIVILGIGQVNGQDLVSRYFEMDFAEIVNNLKDLPSDSMTLEQQCLFIESQARSGNGTEVFNDLQRLLSKFPENARVLTTAGILYHSLGKLTLAEIYLTRALQLAPQNCVALLAKTMLLLYLRRFSEAEACFTKVYEINPKLKTTQLFQRIGDELYGATLNPSKMLQYFEILQHNFAQQNKEKKAERYRKKIRLLSGVQSDSLYQVFSPSDRVELPMVDFAPGVYYKCLILNLGKRSFRILLDTGNAVGWTVHHPDLLALLETRLGREQSVTTGSVEKSLESREILTTLLDLGDFKMASLPGYYFKKPRENYFDANLNPIFIRNRVVTLDFVHNKFLLRSKARFDRDLTVESDYNQVKLPFYGYEWPFVPVLINGYAPALAMIETGAEDVSLKEAYSRFIHLPLKPAMKVWGERKLHYYKATEVSILLGPQLLYRSEMEIWPKRFYDRITGLYDQVMIGPFALQNRFIVSFDPFENVIMLQTPRRD